MLAAMAGYVLAILVLFSMSLLANRLRFPKITSPPQDNIISVQAKPFLSKLLKHNKSLRFSSKAVVCVKILGGSLMYSLEVQGGKHNVMFIFIFGRLECFIISCLFFMNIVILFINVCFFFFLILFLICLFLCLLYSFNVQGGSLVYLLQLIFHLS